MRHFLLSLLIPFTIIEWSNAQSVHTDYYDGKIYVRTEKSQSEIPSDAKKVDMNKVFFLSEQIQNEFGITKVSKPFYFAYERDLRTIYEVEFSEISRINELVEYLNRQSQIDYAEPIPIMRTIFTPNDLGPSSGTSNQWSLWQVDATNAWDISLGNSNIVVAIVDDAVLATHPDLAPVLWVNPGEIPNDGIDNDGNGHIDDVNGWDVADNDNTVLPNVAAMSHGTHVAGISGAASNNGTGVASIGHGVSIMAVKSSNQDQYITDGYEGIIYAYQNGADVINMSWGGSGSSQTAQNIINSAFNAGSILVAAAGNDNVTTQFYPAAYNNVISVASTTTTDARSSFSNYGNWIDISAPGSNIRSTYINSSGAAIYGAISGTSMASPMVAGMIGLMLSLNPNLTYAQLTNCLYSTADPTTTNVGQMGAGRFNAYEAMLCVQASLQTEPLAQINAVETNVCAGADVHFSASSAGGPATSYSWSFPGGTPATSNSPNPVVTYASNGNYSVTLILSNAFGSDTLSIPNYITVSNTALNTVFFEDFESASPNVSVVNPDGGITWAVTNTAGNGSGTKSAFMNFYNYNTTGQRDGLITGTINLNSSSNAELKFKHAYRRYNQNSSDSLIIYASVNNGTTWTRLWARGENGNGIFATQSTNTSAFTPSIADDWCFSGSVGSACYTVNLNAYDGEANLRLKFEGYNNSGNNLYIDDIQVVAACSGNTPAAPLPSFSSNFTNICEGDVVSFVNSTVGATDFLWQFPGGTPSSSILPNPQIVYNTSGIYPVTLEASNLGGANNITQNAYITVNPVPVIQAAYTGGVLSVNPGGLSYQWYKNNAFITGANQQNYTPQTNGQYHVVVSNMYGCSAISQMIDVYGLSLESEWEQSIELFPNPANDWVQLKWNQIPVNRIELLDMYGRVISSDIIQHVNSWTYSTAHLAEGVYFIKLHGDANEIAVKKIVVKH